MNNYLKPQSPLKDRDGDYVYPLTTADQVVMPKGDRLNSINFLSIDSGESVEGGAISQANADLLNHKPAEYYASKDDVHAAKTEAVSELKTYTNAAVQKAAPRNLLDNSDWRVKKLIVNQRGQDSYAGKVYGIDRWYGRVTDQTVSVRDGDITVTATSNSYAGIKQKIEDIAKYAGKTVTLVLNVYSTKGVAVGFVDASDTALAETVDNTGGRRSVICTFTIPYGVTPDTVIPRLLLRSTTANDYMRLYWAALYEGEYTEDTLPEYQPNGYENELLVCRQYDPSTGNYIGLRKFGQPSNLLDNSDFRNPVNQRSKTKYTDIGYTIDRWRTWANTSVSIKDGYISTTGNIYQYFQKTSIHNDSAIYTLAVRLKDGSTRIVSHKFSEASAVNNPTEFWIEDGELVIRIAAGDLVWAALYEGEYTEDTLPQYQSKGYAAELDECLRYYYRIKAYWKYTAVGICVNATTAAINFRFPQPMRVCPTSGINIPDPSLIKIKCGATAEQVPSDIVWNAANTTIADSIDMGCTITGATAGDIAVLYFDNAGIIEFSADL